MHQFVMREIDLEHAIGIVTRANGDGQAAQWIGEFDPQPLEGNHAERLDC